MMKCLVLFLVLCTGSAVVEQKDRTITKVVKLLQGMLEKSKKEGDEERTIFAKFKCYCDTNNAEKTASIEEKTEQIAVLESRIAKVQGETGELSSECADLKAKMADNKAERAEAKALRGKENKAFEAEQTDLVDAIAQMKSALATLAAVGGDQTKSTGADNKQFMAGHKGASLVGVQAQVQDALQAASALMSAEQRSTAAAFVQAPFTGTYTSQSAQVVGILKEMRDTFKANLADARTTEKNSLEAFNKFTKVKEDAFDSMETSYNAKQKILGGNDNALSSDKAALKTKEGEKADDEDFLAQLVALCAKKSKNYENRKMMRANEEAAVAEAVSILDSDAAFATFATTDATSSGATSGGKLLQTSAFIQMRSVRRHMSGDEHKRKLAQKLLDAAARNAHSARLSKVAGLLQAENPFTTVLGEIKKMLNVIAEEGKADQKKFDWCADERKTNNAALKQHKSDITGDEKDIDDLTKAINDPKTGLKALIQQTEDNLVQNEKDQTTQTKTRTEENVAYQADVANLVDASELLEKAIKVLSAYYDDLAKKIEAKEALVQMHKEDPVAPEAFAGDKQNEDVQFKGQSEAGNKIIGMLNFIKDETNKEEKEAHSDEESAQADYEDSMTKLKKDEADFEKSLVKNQDLLAVKEKALLQAQEDLKATTADKVAVEEYLLKIKPGCDFIKTNFAQREANRKTESDALNKATTLIKATPAYKTAVTAATNESYGDCKSCVDDKDHAKCKACMADVTIPAYCAGHKGTKGC